MKITVELPMKVESVANLREHWAKRTRRVRDQRFWTRTKIEIALRGITITLSVRIVTLTRIAPRDLDDDNLASAFKAVRDGVADALGMNDRDPRLTWRYAQERGLPREYAARITLDDTAAPGARGDAARETVV